jgi:hypothetical protein
LRLERVSRSDRDLSVRERLLNVNLANPQSVAYEVVIGGKEIRVDDRIGIGRLHPPYVEVGRQSARVRQLSEVDVHGGVETTAVATLGRRIARVAQVGPNVADRRRDAERREISTRSVPVGEQRTLEVRSHVVAFERSEPRAFRRRTSQRTRLRAHAGRLVDFLRIDPRGQRE